MKKAIAYYRVSTDKQGIRGLGMEAQHMSVTKFAELADYTILQSFEEVMSGTKNKRPQITAALEACKKQGATLLIAKLDRLARDVGFVDALLKSDVKFIAVDMPAANKTMLQMHAVFAEFERDQISARTTAALIAAKQRGVVLGNPVSAKHADARAEALRIKIEDCRACGAKSAAQIGKMLDMHTTQVQRVLKRIEEMDKL
jgi:DNA invertase Pin-like site-specific DNA recombinase